MEAKNEIFEKQNTELFIERLRAQGYIYDQAKSYSFEIVLLSTIVVVVLTILGFFFHSRTLEVVSILYGLFASIIGVVLEIWRSNKKEFAARIQQLIDCELFNITWWRNWGEKPALEDIQEAAKNETLDRYVNWYDKAIQGVSKQAAIVICFRSNIMYDRNLRNKYMMRCHVIFWTIMVVSLLLCFIFKFSLIDICIYGIAPALPIILMYVQTWVAKVKDTSNLEHIRSDIEAMQSRMLSGEAIPPDENLIIQDAIFEHRKNSFFVPSFFYKRLRTENEEDLHTFCVRLAEQLKDCK